MVRRRAEEEEGQEGGSEIRGERAAEKRRRGEGGDPEAPALRLDVLGRIQAGSEAWERYSHGLTFLLLR
eukprot:614704-Hanusia_phi.AAC.1